MCFFTMHKTASEHLLHLMLELGMSCLPVSLRGMCLIKQWVPTLLALED